MNEIDVSKCEFCNTEDYELPMCQQKKYRNEVEVLCREKKDCYYKQLQQANKKLEKIKEIIKTDIENEDITLQKFSKMWYFSLSPKGKILQDILNIIVKKKGKG